MPETPETSNRITALADILWGFIQDLERVRHQKRKPSVDKVLRVAHAVSQLSAAYLKVAEADVVFREVPDLQERIRQLAASTNGHEHPSA